MPVLAIFGAGAALFGGGAAAIGTVLGIGTATLTLGTALTAVAAVGATLGAIGAVTGDKTLSTIGMITGAVGGIGALAANAGLFGASATTESLFGPSSTAASGADASLTAAGHSALQTAASSANDDIISSLGSFKPDMTLPSFDAGTSAVAGSASSDLSGLLSSSADPATAAARLNPTPSGVTFPSTSVSAPGGMPTADASVSASALPTTSAPAAPTADVTGAPSVGMPKNPTLGQSFTGADGETYKYTGAGSTGWEQQKGFFENLVSSPSGQLGMLQAGGSLISGFFDPVKPAQVDALNAQAAVNRAAANLSTTQQTNMAAPIPVATRAQQPQVTGAPQGLINNPVNRSVTGVAA